ncbi:hypothetical protein LDENG_00139680 [Lucifuga dentata]|nr:hypothetical protein LDENG_00139680 [Lucifuga dentata]
MLVHCIVYALLWRMIMQTSVICPCRLFHLLYMLKPHDLQGDVGREDLFYCVLYCYLDCRRVKHENVPSNFQAPLCMCVMYKNVTY